MEMKDYNHWISTPIDFNFYNSDNNLIENFLLDADYKIMGKYVFGRSFILFKDSNDGSEIYAEIERKDSSKHPYYFEIEVSENRIETFPLILSRNNITRILFINRTIKITDLIGRKITIYEKLSNIESERKIISTGIITWSKIK